MAWWRIEELTAPWLSEALGAPVAGVDVEPFARSGATVTVRVAIDAPDAPDLPASVLVVAAAPSWQGTDQPFRRLVAFHTLPRTAAIPTVARCLAAELDHATGDFWLVLHDSGRATVGDELAGITRGKAQLVIAALADVHTTLDDRAVVPGTITEPMPIDRRGLGELYVRFVENFGEQIAPHALGVANRVVSSVESMIAHQRQSTSPQAVVHGDFRLGNVLFGWSGTRRPITIVNWQHAHWGSRATDLSTFLGTALDPRMRREFGVTLLSAYHRIVGGDLEALRRDVRDAAFHCVVNAITSWADSVGARTDDTERLWLTHFHRACGYLIDLESTTSPHAATLAAATDLSRAGARRHPAPRGVPPDDEFGADGDSHTVVSPVDEGPHPPAPGDGWNETWYLDVADPTAGVGASMRFGVGPDNPTGWFSLTVCGPDLPTITLSEPSIDIGRVLAGAPGTVTCSVVDPLAHIHIGVDGVGHVVPDASVARSTIGGEVGVRLDLHWYTSARPYQYDLTRVYEVGCMVTGSITLRGAGLPDTPIAIDGPGQRDHAWDAQNWWHTEWYWLAARFDDGSHAHGVDIRLPGLPPVSTGYLQTPGAPIVAIDSCRMVDADTDGHAITAMTFALEPGSLTVTFRALGQGPQLLRQTSGAVAVMPRAWGEFTRSDGRRGVGWVEWNTGSPNL
ncbi:ecdysteroid 22-kinase family protein [Williamsia herbipolensis]|uniref:Ecdysteroid 22-kinase family protein n=1 Tax=Williamsia herbipolensis TaxID=1603258 RepID=A0AAU4JXZ8_9NOCA|nr:phosphotransferase [Williamsia herbipolensis]